MTPEEFADRMKIIRDTEEYWDLEKIHSEMDELMAKALIDLGYEEGIKIFFKQDRWYS